MVLMMTGCGTLSKVDSNGQPIPENVHKRLNILGV